MTKRVFAILLAVLILISTVFYIYFDKTSEKLAIFQEKEEIYQRIEAESERCSGLLSQESGNFADYEYCRKLMQILQPESN